ncbi:MAG: magnesium transporter [Deltaproteobacteria bacterium]|nr:MAG: magnesium transporter [Deltaproteobacteria bacterium]TNF26911.1 MAG: magnesium transporter [Deltaproteobacteria bacterium]
MSVFEHFPEISLHFSKSQGTPIFNEEGIKLGVLNDFFVDYEEIYPVVLAIQYKKNKQFFYIHWNDIKTFSYKKIVVRNGSNVGRSRTYPKASKTKVITSLLANQFQGDTVEYPALGKVILDRQIVDTSGKKVVRVNDIQFIKTGKNLRVTHASIGIRSMMRRLGFEPVVDGVVKIVKPKAKYLSKESLINWKYVLALPDKSVQSNVKVSLNTEQIEELHPSDIADILEELDNHSRDALFNDLDPKIQAEALAEVDEDVQNSILKNKNPEEMAKILENMDTDDAADILEDMDEEKAEQILSNIEDEEIQEEISELLEHKEDSAGGLMTTELFEVSKDLTRSDVLKLIQEKHEELESIYDLYIIDDEYKLLGTLELRDLLIQTDDVTLGEIMRTKHMTLVSPASHWKEVAEVMDKYNLINVPVVDDSGELLGIISVDDILHRLLDE